MKAPLRKIVKITRYAESMFDKNYVIFECGHTGEATENAIRGRCKECGKVDATGERTREDRNG